MTKEKRNKSEVKREEYGVDLSPDDLDVREENNLTKEQVKNSHKEKQRNCNESH